jgi:hypothetical protein
VILQLQIHASNKSQRAPARQGQIEAQRSEGRGPSRAMPDARGLTWQSRSKPFVFYLTSGLVDLSVYGLYRNSARRPLEFVSGLASAERAQQNQVVQVKRTQKQCKADAAYTASDSKIRLFQGDAFNLNQAKPAPKQPNFRKLGDAGGFKFNGCPTQEKPIFESRAVYNRL